MQKNILHIHGFNSSPQSMKAEMARQYFHEHFPNVNFLCPQLANSPKEAIAQLTQIIDAAKQEAWYLIGSSLGGYFAHYLAEKYHLKAVLVNPAIKPFTLLEDYIGEQTNPYTNMIYQVTEQYMSDLKALEQNAPSVDNKQKNNYLIMVQTGDEVLDYQQAVDKFQHSYLIIEQGGDHSFKNFDKRLPMIAEFFQL